VNDVGRRPHLTMKPSRVVTFNLEKQQQKSTLNELCESMGRIRIEKSIHKFPLFSILKPTAKSNQIHELTESLSVFKISKSPKPTKYFYASPMTRQRELPRSANPYYTPLEQSNPKYVTEKDAEKDLKNILIN
jgi:hypothetical protein